MSDSIQIALSLDGGLEVLLPGAEGSLRHINLPLGREVETLLGILRGREQNARLLGQSGAPTQAQILHAKHSVWPSDKCAFCIEEERQRQAAKRLLGSEPPLRVGRVVREERYPSGVVVRHLAAKRSGKRKSRSLAPKAPRGPVNPAVQSASDLGF